MVRSILAALCAVFALSACLPVSQGGSNGGDVKPLVGAAYLRSGPNGETPAGHVRIGLYVVERNVAVTAAIAGKRPGQWDVAVRDLLFAGKARIAQCDTAKVRFSHMDANIAPGRYSVLHLAPTEYSRKEVSPIVSRSTAELRWVPDAARPERHFMQMDVPLVNGNAQIYLPDGAFKASMNPVGQFWIPEEDLYGLPKGNNTGTLVTTPRNDTFGTENDFVRAMQRPFLNHDVFMIVRPGACR